MLLSFDYFLITCINGKITIQLLYKCVYSTSIWSIIQTCFTEQINLQSVILGNDSVLFNTVISIFAFLIYKEWLLLKKENKVKVWATTILFLANESQFRSKIYYQLNQTDIADRLHDISYKLRNMSSWKTLLIKISNLFILTFA